MPFKLFDLTGRTAVVVGGTTGIGHALSLALAEAGADVIPTSRRAEVAASTVLEIEALGRRSLLCPCDVRQRASLETLHRSAIEEFGKVDILINCAAQTKRSPTLDVPEDEWNSIIATNVTGTLLAAQVFGRDMLQRGYGRIINIASIGGLVSMFEVAAYSASKAAVVSLTKSLAIEWGPRGICVNAIAPGVFKTDLNANLVNGTARGREFLIRTPMKRFGNVDELGGAAVFLASDAASFVNGEILVVDGGLLASGVNE
jgi:NAD(P)-dependent dehydrogenase (short-subunit alcohol dehydrogenase family)